MFERVWGQGFGGLEFSGVGFGHAIKGIELPNYPSPRIRTLYYDYDMTSIRFEFVGGWVPNIA